MNHLFMWNRVVLALGDEGTYSPFSGEAWGYAAQVTLLGLGMVFAVLAVLWGVLALFKLIFAGKTPKAPKASKEPKSKEVVQTAPQAVPDDAVAAVIAASIQAIQEDEAATLVAILTAAVAAHRSEEGTEGEFRVVSFKRSGSGRAWNAKK